MFETCKTLISKVLTVAVAVVVLFPVQTINSAAGTLTTIYHFSGGNDGYAPYDPLVRDQSGNLYGTTYFGGNTACNSGSGCGVVFRVTSSSTESVLYSFTGGTDGYSPLYGGLIVDQSGNLYGTTLYGGGTGCSQTGSSGCGTVFKIATDGTETVLYRFVGGTHGQWPYAGLIMDSNGNLYGTTTAGGNKNKQYGCTDRDGNSVGCGVIFKIAPNGTETVLYSFCAQTNCTDGAIPWATLIADSSGNFYGTTQLGGTTDQICTLGCGVVFKLATNGAETVLHSFDFTDGEYPESPLIADSQGNLYGTANGGGADTLPYGAVFKLASDGTLTVLHSFSQHNFGDGLGPTSGLVLVPSTTGNANLYGTTNYGGDSGCGGGNGCGSVYRVSTSGGTLGVVYRFQGSPDGYPNGLILGQDSNLYGTTTNDYGTVYKLSTSVPGKKNVERR